MLNCHNATRLMSEAQERKLAVSEVMSLKFHRMMCQGCNNFGKQMVGLRTMARVYVKNDIITLDKDDNASSK